MDVKTSVSYCAQEECAWVAARNIDDSPTVPTNLLEHRQFRPVQVHGRLARLEKGFVDIHNFGDASCEGLRGLNHRILHQDRWQPGSMHDRTGIATHRTTPSLPAAFSFLTLALEGSSAAREIGDGGK